MFAAPAPPTGPTLAHDRHCRRCGYNLRSLPESGKCPECATPVALSIRGDLLKYADPAWVLTLARGASIVAFAIVVAMLAFAIMFIGAMAGFTLFMVLMAVWPLAGVAVLIGQWLVTRRDPSAPAEDDSITSRVAVRAAVVTVLGLFVSQSAANLLRLGPAGPVTSNIIQIGINVLIASWIVVYFRHLAALCMRIPDLEFVKTCRRIGLLLAVLLIAVSVTAMIPGLAWGNPAMIGGTGVIAVVQMFVWLLPLVLLIYALRATSIHLRVAKRMRAEAELAKLNWTTAA